MCSPIGKFTITPFNNAADTRVGDRIGTVTDKSKNAISRMVTTATKSIVSIGNFAGIGAGPQVIVTGVLQLRLSYVEIVSCSLLPFIDCPYMLVHIVSAPNRQSISNFDHGALIFDCATPSVIAGPQWCHGEINKRYDKINSMLKIHIDKARGLKARGSAANAAMTNPYVKTYLHSKPRESSWKRKTKIVQRTTDPVFAEDLTSVYTSNF